MTRTCDNFAVLILSHGRPKKVETLKALARSGYTGRTFIVIDDKDPTAEEYFALYPGQVIQFRKDKVPPFDMGDNIQQEVQSVIFARNACWGIARELGIRYFWELDDDYSEFSYRKPEGDKLLSIRVKQLDRVIEAVLTFLDSSDKIKTVAFLQGGELFGGVKNPMMRRLKRKAMNTFFCDTEKPFTFVGRINEDVNTYVTGGIIGDIFLTVREFSILQEQTQKTTGGMTEIYKKYGTYLKSFYSVMFAPACVKINQLGTSNKRIHHKIDWVATCPKIISDKWQKTRKKIDITTLKEELNNGE